MSTYEHSNETYVKSGLKLQVFIEPSPNSAKFCEIELQRKVSGQFWSRIGSKLVQLAKNSSKGLETQMKPSFRLIFEAVY